MADATQQPQTPGAKVKKQAEQRSTVPDLEYIVHQVRNSQTWDFTTEAGLCAYSNAVVVALYAEDGNFGHLRKDPGQTHCTDPAGQLCARDVALFKPTGQIIDFIISGGYGTPPPPNEVAWGVGPYGEYLADIENKWFAPVAGAGDGGSTGGGDVDAETKAQLDRMEAMLNEIKLYMSNMNAQMSLGFTEVNNIRAAQNPPYSGDVPRNGGSMTLHPQG